MRTTPSRYFTGCQFLAPFCLVALFHVASSPSSQAQNDLRDIPVPDPVAEKAAMRVDSSAAVDLFAADPDIRKPIQINFDAEGGLWVASSEVYPQIEPGEKADDKIIVLRDTNRDGTLDSSTVFADGLLIPTGVLPDGVNAAYVAESTQLIHLKDTDGDGRADDRRVILSGFGTEDTHHLVHTLRWGPDGCVYFNQSIYIHSHIDTPEGTRRLDGGGIWRYRPSTGQLEVLCKGFVNPWGHIFDSVGESFATDGAYFEGINYVFPDSVFVTSPGASRWLSGMNPGSPKHCGLEVLSGSHIPPDWNGDLVTSDFRSHRVCRFTVRPDGSGYFSRQQPEILTTSHVAFRPIDARMGPDGALYVADWYNPIIQHGEVDFRDERRDRKHGRIWRVWFPDRPLDPWPEFKSASIEQLLDLLADDSQSVRQFARQELWCRDASAVAEKMIAWQQAATGDTALAAQRALERLWMGEVAGRLDTQHALAALTDPAITSEATMRPVIRSVWRSLQLLDAADDSRAKLTAVILSKTNDPNPKARLEAVVCAGQLASLDAARSTMDATAHPVDANLDFALWQTLTKLQSQWVPATLDGRLDWTGKEDALAFAVSSVNTPQAAETILARLTAETLATPSTDRLFQAAVGAGNAEQLGTLLDRLAGVDSLERRAELLKRLVERTNKDGASPSRAGERLAAQLSTANALVSVPAWAHAVADAAAAWKAQPLETILVEAIHEASESLAPRIVLAVGSLPSETAKQTVDELARGESLSLRTAAIATLIGSRPQAAIEPLIATLEKDSADEAALDLVARIIQRKELPPLLAEKLASHPLEADVARAMLRRVRSAGGNEPLENAIRSAGKLDDAAWKLTPEWSKSILEKVKANGSATAGELVYRRAQLQCIQCHAIGPAGGLVGPNLISLGGSSQLDYILESLIDPSAKLKEGYTTLSVLTDDGRLASGIVIGRDDSFVRMRLADGKEIQIAAESIEEESAGKSLMPAGLLDEVTEKELVDLVAFLSELGRTPAFTVATKPLVRSLETLVYSNEANRVLNRTSIDAVATPDPNLTWRTITTFVDGRLPLDELDRFQQHKQVPPSSFIRFKVKLPETGTLGLSFQSTGIEAWVDGKPTPVWNLESMRLEAGTHEVVLAIDRNQRVEPFAIQFVGDAIPQ